MFHALKTTIAALGALSLTACGGGKVLLPSTTSESSKTFQNYEQVETAYIAVAPGKTNSAELAKLGFSVKSSPNIEILTYVGVVERLPQDARTKGAIPPPVQACFDAGDRCSAYIFRPGRIESHHVGNTVLELTGFESSTVDEGWSAEVMLLIQDDVVVYKQMNGQPLIGDEQRTIQPLGPLQDAYTNATKQQD